ncbi:hypothetical protein KC951_00410 [Candidatus Saccharibacteria bacterium]|nr:hypothetical protein [Candidatus Saccharibacteria bacterium]
MKAIMLYRPDSESARAVLQYAQEFKRRTGKDVELIDVDSKEGLRLLDLYDIMQHPTILAVASDGQLLNTWRGEPLPLIDDVNGYLVEQ